MNRKFYYLSCLLPLAACAVGPDYHRPSAPASAHFKEQRGPAGEIWKQATPQDEKDRGAWWRIFGDETLNRLMPQVAVTNQNVKLAEASYRQAVALVGEARAGFFPTVTLGGSATRNGYGGGSTGARASGYGGVSSGVIVNDYSATGAVSWTPDLWGKIRRSVEAGEASAAASQANLANATLSAQGTLAATYFSLRVDDEEILLLERTVENYRRALSLTQHQYQVGVAARSDVLQAQVQLGAAQAQAVDLQAQRAQYEHAIAVLLGKTPADFSLPPVKTTITAVPPIPVSLSSTLLERRPDIAAAERNMQSANAQIGVAEAAYFPSLTLSASGGYQSNSFVNWFSLPSRVWSIGPSLAETVFDAGLRGYQTDAARAGYDQTIATYRQTVLAAFQSTEDALAGLRILAQEAKIQAQTVKDAQASTAIALNQYKAGTQTYVAVVTAQNAELTQEINSLNVKKTRLVDAVDLIQALGGGWEGLDIKSQP
jgi:NodT family efflux transporter outer membrane factor (OMF) lipoprotein